MKIPVIVIAGPTASGKSDAALNIALKYGGEIVSCDSMQIYRGLDIGTAKPTKEEQKKVPHHMIDICSVNDRFSAADFVKGAKKAIEDIYLKGHIPIVSGGTGLYIDSLIYGVRYSHAAENPVLRESLSQLAKSEGNEAVHGVLKRLDKNAAEKIHPNNLKRVIRAVEIISATGKSLEESIEKPEKESSRYDCLYTVLVRERKELYGRIDKRVEVMISQGLYDEAKWLFENIENKNATSMQAIGYKELLPVYEGKMTLEEAAEILKKDTRHYAKRQMTWFNKKSDAVFIDCGEDILKEYEKIDKFREIMDSIGKDRP